MTLENNIKMTQEELIHQVAYSWHFKKEIPKNLITEFKKIPHDERMRLLSQEIHKMIDKVSDEEIQKDLSDAKEKVDQIRKQMYQVSKSLDDMEKYKDNFKI